MKTSDLIIQLARHIYSYGDSEVEIYLESNRHQMVYLDIDTLGVDDGICTIISGITDIQISQIKLKELMKE